MLAAGQGRGRLSDFDISIDTNMRTSVQFSTARLGYTAGFDAPELRATGATFATDMFAFGSTVDAVRAKCDPSADQREQDDTQQLVAAFITDLTHQDPLVRTSAAQALKHGFFEPVTVYQRAETRVCGQMLNERCVEERIALSQGIQCATGHFTSAWCLEALVLKSIEAGGDTNCALHTRQADGKIHCTHCLAEQPRTFTAFADVDLARALGATVFDQYLRARMKVLEDKMQCELQAEMKQTLEGESACMMLLMAVVSVGYAGLCVSGEINPSCPKVTNVQVQVSECGCCCCS